MWIAPWIAHTFQVVLLLELIAVSIFVLYMVWIFTPDRWFDRGLAKLGVTREAIYLVQVRRHRRAEKSHGSCALYALALYQRFASGKYKEVDVRIEETLKALAKELDAAELAEFKAKEKERQKEWKTSQGIEDED